MCRAVLAAKIKYLFILFNACNIVNPAAIASGLPDNVPACKQVLLGVKIHDFSTSCKCTNWSPPPLLLPTNDISITFSSS
jgi:hypothetical protein